MPKQTKIDKAKGTST